MTHSSQPDRERTIREALDQLEDWILTNDRDPELASHAERFLCEYVILNAHDESVRRMWREYTTPEGAANVDETEA